MKINLNEKPIELNSGDVICYVDNSNIEQYRLIVCSNPYEFLAIDLKYNDVVAKRESLKDIFDYYNDADFVHNLKIIHKNNIILTLEV